MTDYRAMQAVSVAAALDPTPGDYWHEMLSAICLVVAREGDAVCVCSDREPVGDKHYRFINPRWMRVADFTCWLSYDARAGTWADAVHGHDVSSYADLIPPIPDLEAEAARAVEMAMNTGTAGEPSEELEKVARALFARYMAANRWSLAPPDWDVWPAFHETCLGDARAAIGAALLEPSMDLIEAVADKSEDLRLADHKGVADWSSEEIAGAQLQVIANHILGENP